MLNPGMPGERTLRPLSDGNRFQRGDVLRIETGGGGGRGHPHDRPAAAVLADVLGGMVSPEAARLHYGVVIRDGAVDSPATAALRADRPAAMAFHRGSYADVLD
jgi:N-methylhydantoinase B